MQIYAKHNVILWRKVLEYIVVTNDLTKYEWKVEVCVLLYLIIHYANLGPYS